MSYYKPICPDCKTILTDDFEREYSEDFLCEKCNKGFYESQVNWKSYSDSTLFTTSVKKE